MIKEKEIWLPVVGFESHYLISNYGRIKSVSGRMRKNGDSKRGYQNIDFWVHNKRHSNRVHRLVANAFVPNPQDKPYVNHIDNNPRNNYYKNLEWVTQSENLIHAVSIGAVKHGEKSPYAILTEKEVLEIARSAENHIVLSKGYGVSRQTITDIKSGKKWHRVTGIVYKKKRTITKDMVLKIFKESGTISDISNRYGVSKETVSHIKVGIRCAGVTGKVHKPSRNTNKLKTA